MQYTKYEFDTLPEILTSEEGIPNASFTIAGKLEKEKATYDEEGNELTPPIISDKIAVDIIWDNEPLEELEPFRVTPAKPKHTILGQEALYNEKI